MLKESEIMFKKQSISAFLDIAKLTNFWWKNDISRTKGVCHVSHIKFGSSLDKV